MYKLHEIFGKKKVVLPVVHVENEEQALRNVEIAKRAGADGVFLINHSMTTAALLEIYNAVREKFFDYWIGLNCLDITPLSVFSHVLPLRLDISGVWTDNAMISEINPHQSEARRILEIISEIGWRGLYFGGVAFKYQPLVNDLRLVIREASCLMDVITTSGEGTGIAADVEKIKTIWDALDEGIPLAIASGITPENVSEYLPFVDAFLVATGISDSDTELNENKTRTLVEKVHKYKS